MSRIAHHPPAPPTAAGSAENKPDLPATRLLVSVRSSAEALAALAGGADWIDVKEPAHGPMGAACIEVIAEVAEAVAGRRPVTVAGGELTDLSSVWLKRAAALPGVAAIKVGLAGTATIPGWTEALLAAQRALPRSVALAPVVYADHYTACCASVEQVMEVSGALGFEWLVIDTHDKSSGRLFDHWPVEHARASLRATGLHVVLAGRLDGAALRCAAALRPAVVGVRSMACDGGRAGVVSATRVAAARGIVCGALGRAAVNLPSGRAGLDARGFA